MSLLCCIHDVYDILTWLPQIFLIGYITWWCVMWRLGQDKIGRYDDKHVLITGCDSGFGLLLAKKLDSLGFKVFAGCLTPLGQETVENQCSENVSVLDMNVTLKDSVKRARETVEKHLPEGKGLWAVVNNAGIAGPVAPAEWLTEEDFEQTINVNLMGVIYVTKSFLPLVRKEKGRIVNMASICGRLAVATSSYCASKYGVEGFTDVLRHELYKTGCKVSVIEPGYFNTGIVTEDTIQEGLDKKFNNLDEDVQNYYGTQFKDGSIKRHTRFLSLAMTSNVDLVVNAYVHAVTSKYPKARYCVGWDYNITFRVFTLLPDAVTGFLFGFFMEKPAGS